MALNSALPQNWVMCTVRAHCAQVECALRAVMRAAAYVAIQLHAQGILGHVLCRYLSSQQLDRDLHFPIATSFSRSRHKPSVWPLSSLSTWTLGCNPLPVEPCRDTKTCRDINFSKQCRDIKTVSRHHFLQTVS